MREDGWRMEEEGEEGSDGGVMGVCRRKTSEDDFKWGEGGGVRRRDERRGREGEVGQGPGPSGGGAEEGEEEKMERVMKETVGAADEDKGVEGWPLPPTASQQRN